MSFATHWGIVCHGESEGRCCTRSAMIHVFCPPEPCFCILSAHSVLPICCTGYSEYNFSVEEKTESALVVFCPFLPRLFIFGTPAFDGVIPTCVFFCNMVRNRKPMVQLCRSAPVDYRSGGKIFVDDILHLNTILRTFSRIPCFSCCFSSPPHPTPAISCTPSPGCLIGHVRGGNPWR